MVVAFGLGAWILSSGIKDYQNNQRLTAEGQLTTAQVLDRSTRSGRRGARRYYLSVQFQNQSGQSVQRSVQVDRSAYRNAETASTVPLRYLSSEPAICAVGEPVPVWRGSLISGALLVLSGGVLLVLGRQGLTTRAAAEKIVEHAGALCESHYEYASVKANEFKHLDLAWYDASQRWLEVNGFARLGDEENLTFRRTSKGNRTLLRTMLGRDGTCIAYLYHFKPATATRRLSADGARILELQTQFANSTFICTSNAEAAGKLDAPPGVNALHLPAATALEAILAAHAQRVSACLTHNPGVAATRLIGLEDVHRFQNVLQQMKATYRRNTGITKEELTRLAGNRLYTGQIDALHADVAKLHAEQKRTAA